MAHLPHRRPSGAGRWNANRDESGRWTYAGWQRAVAQVGAGCRHSPVRTSCLALLPLLKLTWMFRLWLGREGPSAWTVGPLQCSRTTRVGRNMRDGDALVWCATHCCPAMQRDCKGTGTVVLQVEDAIRLHGPFDGVMGFSQVSARAGAGIRGSTLLYSVAQWQAGTGGNCRRVRLGASGREGRRSSMRHDHERGMRMAQPLGCPRVSRCHGRRLSCQLRSRLAKRLIPALPPHGRPLPCRAAPWRA